MQIQSLNLMHTLYTILFQRLISFQDSKVQKTPFSLSPSSHDNGVSLHHSLTAITSQCGQL